MNEYDILNKVDSPSDLKKLSGDELNKYCGEAREFIIENVIRSGGHLASNLGVVELTVAIHKIFDVPDDHLIFDVGHQSYTHKLITGRRDSFFSLRKFGGLSGFTKRSESEYDCFGAGHSSTSLSAALGFAHADKMSGKDSTTIAVVGDGAFTGGMIHEALNNCDPSLRLVIVLNENEMSISRNTGKFAENIARIRSSKGYYKTKRNTANFIRSIPFIGDFLFNSIKSVKKSIKNKIYGSNYFEDLGLYYIGPVDGNDLQRVMTVLSEAKSYGKACIVHVRTKKGLGYPEAENDPGKYHGIQPYGAPEFMNFSTAAGEYLSDLAEADDKICAITAAMAIGTGLVGFSKKHPDRFFDVGIAEEHALTFSAGLAAAGFKPFFAVYSSFLQRGYDNIIHDISLQNLYVTLLIDRAGLSSSDGPTHHGIFDVSILSSVPNVDLYCPLTFESLRKALARCRCSRKLSAVRYPNSPDFNDADSFFDMVSDDLRIKNADCNRVIITYGKISLYILKKINEIGAKLIVLERLMPYNIVASEINRLISPDDNVVFVEEGIRNGGAGNSISRYLNSDRYSVVAIDDPFCEKIRSDDIYEAYGLGIADIMNAFEANNEKG